MILPSIQNWESPDPYKRTVFETILKYVVLEMLKNSSLTAIYIHILGYIYYPVYIVHLVVVTATSDFLIFTFFNYVGVVEKIFPN